MAQDVVLTGECLKIIVLVKNLKKSEILDMLHSLYDFKATYAKTLSFQCNDYFILHQTNTKHKNWWEVINEDGEMGFIPSNYVETVTVNPSFYLQFLENCLDNLQRFENIGERQEVVDRLKELKRQVELLPECMKLDRGDAGRLLSYSNSDGHRHNSVRSSSSSHSSLLSDIKNEVVKEEPIKPVQRTSKEKVRKSIENIHEEVNSEVCQDRKKSGIFH